MIILGAALIAIGGTQFFVGQAIGAVAIAIGTLLVLIAFWRYRVRGRQALSKRSMRQQHITYAHIDEVLDQLEDMAQERNWNIDKRFEIARMACENPAVSFDELERHFDEGRRSVFYDIQQEASDTPEKGAPQ